jgi:septal ring factor EnvC (AmiA/AmiB activator)
MAMMRFLCTRRHTRLTVLLISILAPACSRTKPKPSQTAAVDALDHLSHELDRLQNDVQDKNREISSLLRQYQEKGGRLPENFGPDLTEEQRRLLATRFQDERLGLRETLQDILARDREIVALKARIATIEQGLPTSVVAQAGDTHDGILLKFLEGKGVKEAEARPLLQQMNLQVPLLPGHRVWVYYRDGALGSWVTTGDIATSPREAAHQAIQALLEQRDAARQEAKSLRRELAGATAERAQLRTQITDLQAAIGEWTQEVDGLRRENHATDQAARYLAGSKKELREHGIISGGFLKATRVRRLQGLETLDLSQSAEILLRSTEYGLGRIRKIDVLPEGFERGQDYVVHLLKGGTLARVALLDVDKFRKSTFVVVME